MLAEQRYQKILNLMQEDGSVRVSELKKLMDVSAETIRRDLENMEQQGLIRRTRGGAFLNEKEEYRPFDIRGAQERESKQEIAEFAASFIEEGQAIALDSGTTSYELARVIKHKFQNLTVVTNSVAIVNELAGARGITIIATGGVYRAEEMAFVSEMAGLIFEKLNIHTFFLTTCGISVDRGITYQRMDEIIVQEKMMEASDQTYVITDSSKLGVNSLVKMCDIDRVSRIITDSKATEEQLLPFVRAGVLVSKPE